MVTSVLKFQAAFSIPHFFHYSSTSLYMLFTSFVNYPFQISSFRCDKTPLPFKSMYQCRMNLTCPLISMWDTIDTVYLPPDQRYEFTDGICVYRGLDRPCQNETLLFSCVNCVFSLWTGICPSFHCTRLSSIYTMKKNGKPCLRILRLILKL